MNSPGAWFLTLVLVSLDLYSVVVTAGVFHRSFQHKMRMHISVFLITLCLYSSSAAPNSSFIGDGRVLISMKATMDDPAHMLDGWRASDNTTHCSWTGVQCDHVSRVVGLHLSFMSLSGPFPNQVTNLSALRLLKISQNDFNGILPSDISKLKNLEVLDVSDNILSGPLPLELSYLVKLRHLGLGENRFSGSIPGEYGKLKNVEFLSLSQNNLSGRIPGELRNLGHLKVLYLGNSGFDLFEVNNKFDGGIPQAIGNLSKLVHLDMISCGLSGEIPSQLGGLRNLERMSFQGNGFIGEIPLNLSALNEMQKLNLSHNRLHGRIPSFIQDLPNLEVLELSKNNFTGLLPGQLGASGKLIQVDVSSNRLTGSVPPNLCSGGRLEYLHIENNSFLGPIPNFLGTCNSLIEVYMGENKFNGSIHADLLYLPKLTVIAMESNDLSGTIPEKINNVSSMLSMMDISDNRLNGSLHSSIGKLCALQKLDISGNQLTGTIPVELSQLGMLELLDFSANKFSGMIPSEISNCSALIFIDLSQNELRGPIPVEISKMSTLQVLDISRNYLNDSIPTQLQNMQTLFYPNFSYNNFSGIILEGSPFSYLNPTCFAENPYLRSCTSHVNRSRGQARLKRVLLLGLGSPLILICNLLFLAIGVAIIKARSVKEEGDTRLWEMTTFQILEFGMDDILDCIKEENIIGRGGAGVVYGGIMRPNGQQIAVKKLMRTDTSNDHGFSAEIKILGKIRHRHIVTLLAFCSNHDTNLLVYDYMPNGSLGEVLHGNNGAHLQWDSRYKIAVEAAKGLRYLHHDCSPFIIHRDVKSNNILLDCNFEAHIADFGLAKLLHHAATSECVSSIAGTFGYIAPEYAYTLKVHKKSDVYSFGVVLLELITGKRAVEELEFEEGMNIAGWVKIKMSNFDIRGVMKIIDPKLSNFPMEEAMHLLFVALLCLQEQPVHRPSMREIVYILTSCKPTQ